MKTITKCLLRHAAVVITAIVAVGVLQGMSWAQVHDPYSFNLHGKWDFYILGQNLTQPQITFNTKSGVIPISMGSTAMGGIGFTYHVTDVWATRFEFSDGYPTFTGHGIASGTHRTVDLHTGMISVDAYLPTKRIKPFITGGIGLQYLYDQTSNVGTTVAYWDPWYGYTVGTAYAGHTETDFFWTAGVGLRFDVTPSFFLTLATNLNWLNYSGQNGTATQTRNSLSLGLSY